MKVVKRIDTGEIVYRQDSDFETGKGIANAIFNDPSLVEGNLEEVTIEQSEWDTHAAGLDTIISTKATNRQSAINKIKTVCSLTDDEVEALFE